MEIREDEVFFSSGRVGYANNGIIGLSEPNNGEWCVSYGYDGEFNIHGITMAEREELADYMIGLWKRFKVGTD